MRTCAHPIGQRFGKLVVTGTKLIAHRNWLVVRCDCGRELTMRKDHVVKATVVASCGCYWESAEGKSRTRSAKQRAGAAGRRHGMTYSSTWNIWSQMIQRCTNPDNRQYKNYGGRGIRVCDRWRESFEAFLADMGERPAGLTIDRRDNNGNYEPGNCRWATYAQQAQNRRNTKLSLEAAAEIRSLAATGRSKRSIAKQFNVDRCIVQLIVKNKSWSTA